MSQADSTNTTSVPGLGGEALYLPTDVTPEEIFQAIGKLRKEARDEIDRLIGFLDKTDDYVSRELEDDGDQADASYPESGSMVCSPMEDDEPTGDENEPSLGSSALGECSSQESWARGNSHDLEDEHDGAEPENEHGETADDEPSLGWTVDGCIGNTSESHCDAELQDHAPVQPQDRTDLGAGITAETSYRRFLRGLTPDQQRAVRQRADNAGDVLIRD